MRREQNQPLTEPRPQGAVAGAAVVKLSVALALALAVAQTAAAQVIRARPGRNYDTPLVSGTFDVRVYVDGEVDLVIRGGDIGSEVFSGRPIRDAGSEYSSPLPRIEFTRFDVQRVDGRGKVELLEEPSRRNGYTARIRVEDRSGGEDRYHVRITWEVPQSFTQRANPSNPRFETYRGRRGVYSLPGDRLYAGGSSGFDNALEGRFEFRGRVDDEAIFYIRRDQATAEAVRGRRVDAERVQFSQPLPDRALRAFQIRKREGRGNVELLEEPTRENGWTAVVRINRRRPRRRPVSVRASVAAVDSAASARRGRQQCCTCDRGAPPCRRRAASRYRGSRDPRASRCRHARVNDRDFGFR